MFGSIRSAPLVVHVEGKVSDQDWNTLNEAFSNSTRTFEIKLGSPVPPGYPSSTELTREKFSYFETRRIASLFDGQPVPPQLSWSPNVVEIARKKLDGFSGHRLIAVHLRNTKGAESRIANARGQFWAEFLDWAQNEHPEVDFLLIGDDEVPRGVHTSNRLVRANELGMSLSLQLCAISLADGFIGMASGICAAAQFSKTPYVILKDPSYHAEAMLAEVGSANAFPFAGPFQQLWRQEQSVLVLQQALSYILSSYE